MLVSVAPTPFATRSRDGGTLKRLMSNDSNILHAISKTKLTAAERKTKSVAKPAEIR